MVVYLYNVNYFFVVERGPGALNHETGGRVPIWLREFGDTGRGEGWPLLNFILRK